MRTLPLVALLLLGCDSRPPAVPPPVSAGRDAGPPVEHDAGPGGHGDAGSPDISATGCSHTDTFDLGVGGAMRTVPPSLAAGEDRFAIGWGEIREGRPDLFVNGFTSAGELLGEGELTSGPFRETSLRLARLTGGFASVFVDAPGTSDFDVRAQRINPLLDRMGDVETITHTQHPERLLTVTGAQDHVWIGWLEQDAVAGTDTAFVQPVGATGEALGGALTISVEDATPTELAIGNHAGRVTVVAIASSQAWWLRLDPSSTSISRATRLDRSANATGGLDVAFDGDRGAVVFNVLSNDIRQDIRFVRIGDEGQVIGRERSIGSAPSGQANGSITPYADGFVVAYRGLVSLDEAEIRLAFVSDDGVLIDEDVIASAAALGHGPFVRQSDDGNFGLAWTDDEPSGEALRAALVRCGASQ